jgi:hypothetical protein
MGAVALVTYFGQIIVSVQAHARTFSIVRTFLWEGALSTWRARARARVRASTSFVLCFCIKQVIKGRRCESWLGFKRYATIRFDLLRPAIRYDVVRFQKTARRYPTTPFAFKQRPDATIRCDSFKYRPDATLRYDSTSTIGQTLRYDTLRFECNKWPDATIRFDFSKLPDATIRYDLHKKSAGTIRYDLI